MKKAMKEKTGLGIAMVLAILMLGSVAGAFSDTGSGTGQDPYIITNVYQLQEMHYDFNLWACYVLGNDIDASETKNWNNGKGFEPIVSYPRDLGPDVFTGHFDGKGHKITGLYINRPGSDAVGLFSYIVEGAEVKNVGLVNVDVNAVNGDDVGGLVGKNVNGTIENCYSTGSVRGNKDVGGLVGDNCGWIANCYSTGSVTGNERYVGGLVGDNAGTITNCYSTSSVTGNGTDVGGLVGKNWRWQGTIIDCFWDIETSGCVTSAGGTGKTTADMKQKATFTNWDFETVWDIDEGLTYPFLKEVGLPLPTGTLSINLGRNIDALTSFWDYPTNYNAPVFRRGIDNPIFVLELDGPLPECYKPVFEVYSPGSPSPICSGEAAFSYSPSKHCAIWFWTNTAGNQLNKNQIPIGIYTVKGYLVNQDDPSEKTYIDSDDFYVIFDFDRDIQSFVTWDDEIDYLWDDGPIKCATYKLHTYDSQIWKRAVEKANGATTVIEAVDRISELARRIDGDMVFHHARNDETTVFARDDYDNDFDGTIDEADENWERDYEPKKLANLGKAYYRELGWSWWHHIPYPAYHTVWVDAKGNESNSPDEADKIAWYRDTIEMLKEDFDPENKIPDPHQHSVGVCEDYAMLTVAYLRAIGIPARTVIGIDFRSWSLEDRKHAWVHWYEDGTWCSFNPDSGVFEYNHLDIDYGSNHTEWEAEGSWKYNLGDYGITWDHVLVRNSQDSLDVSDIAGEYNTYTTTIQSLMALGSAENETVCNYEIISMPQFKPGEISTVEVNITNPTNEDKTVTVVVELVPSSPYSAESLAYAESDKEITIPAGSTVTEPFDLEVIEFTEPGDYNLEIYEVVDANGVLALRQPSQILAKHTITTETPETIIYNEPFTFSVIVENIENAPIHNISAELDIHYDFNTLEPLKKEISRLEAGASHTFSWTLTPTNYGDLRVDASVSTSDAGTETKIVNVPVNSPPKLYITPEVPEKIASGQDFTLNVAISNTGDTPVYDVNLVIAMPNDVTADKTSVDFGTINGHQEKTADFKISPNRYEDFAIALNIDSLEAKTTNYAFINQAVPGDFDIDGDVDFTDLALFVSHWFDADCNVSNWCEGTDLNHSSMVDFIDFTIFSQNWLKDEK